MKHIIYWIIATVCCEAYSQTSVDSILSLADQQINAYQFDDAIKTLRDIDEKHPSTEAVLKRWGYSLQFLGQHRTAIDKFNQILEQDSFNIYALNRITYSYKSLGDLTEVINIYQKLNAIDTSNSYYHVQLGKNYEQTGHPITALYYYDKALDIQPNNTELYVSIGRLFLQLKQLSAADSSVSMGLQVDSNHIRLLKLHSRILYGQKKYGDAISSVDRLFILGDTNSSLARIKAISSFFQNDYENTIVWLHWILDQGQVSESVFYYLGLAYSKIGNQELAAQYLEKAIAEGHSDNLGHFYTQLGVVYEETGNYPAAIRAFQKAYEMSEQKLILYHLARNYDQYYGDKSTALTYYEKYLSQNDTANEDFMNYSLHRVEELKEKRHLNLD